MSYPKSDPEQKILAICGGTTRAVIELIRLTALKREITVSRLVGDILEEWSRSGGVLQSEIESVAKYRSSGGVKRKRAVRLATLPEKTEEQS